MRENEYRCAVCKKIYKKEWTDAEAKQEFKDHFNREVDETDEIVCDDCYKKVIRINEN